MSLPVLMNSAQATLAGFDLYAQSGFAPLFDEHLESPLSVGSWDEYEDQGTTCAPSPKSSITTYSNSGSPYTDTCSEEDSENIDLDSLQTIEITPQGRIQSCITNKAEHFLKSPLQTQSLLSSAHFGPVVATSGDKGSVQPITNSNRVYHHMAGGTTCNIPEQTIFETRNYHHQHSQGHHSSHQQFSVPLEDKQLDNLRKTVCSGGVRKTSQNSGTGNKSNKEILRKRRLAANERERRRMNSLNLAFDNLRKVIPGLGGTQQLSKYDTLQMAQTYIRALQDILDKPLS